MTSRPIASRTPDSAATESQQSPVRLGLIGRGIDKSLAPAFHTIAGQMLGLDVTYELLPRDAAFSTELDGFLDELGGAGYRGVNITVPFKASAWQAASDASDEVVSTGVANTLLLGPGGPTNAFNTDFSGFKWAYRRRFANVSPGTVALLGAGGVGTATAAALVDLGATAIRIYDIVADRSHALADMLRQPQRRPSGWTWRRRPKRPSTASTGSSTEHLSGCTSSQAHPSISPRSATSGGSSTPSTRRSRPS